MNLDLLLQLILYYSYFVGRQLVILYVINSVSKLDGIESAAVMATIIYEFMLSLVDGVL